MNLYAVAFGIVGAVLLPVGMAPLLPLVRRRQDVRRFRRALKYVDVVAVSWGASPQGRSCSDDVPDPLPVLRRSWRERRRDRDVGGDPWA